MRLLRRYHAGLDRSADDDRQVRVTETTAHHCPRRTLPRPPPVAPQANSRRLDWRTSATVAKGIATCVFRSRLKAAPLARAFPCDPWLLARPHRQWHTEQSPAAARSLRRGTRPLSGPLQETMARRDEARI